MEKEKAEREKLIKAIMEDYRSLSKRLGKVDEKGLRKCTLEQLRVCHRGWAAMHIIQIATPSEAKSLMADCPHCKEILAEAGHHRTVILNLQNYHLLGVRGS